MSRPGAVSRGVPGSGWAVERRVGDPGLEGSACGRARCGLVRGVPQISLHCRTGLPVSRSRERGHSRIRTLYASDPQSLYGSTGRDIPNTRHSRAMKLLPEMCNATVKPAHPPVSVGAFVRCCFTVIIHDGGGLVRVWLVAVMRAS